MVFAAGLGARMRPLRTAAEAADRGRRPRPDRSLPRSVRRERRRAKAIVNVHWLPTRSRRIWRRGRTPKSSFPTNASAARPGRRDQEGAARIGQRAVLYLQHRRVLDRGAALQPRASRRCFRSRRHGRSRCWSPRSAGAVGVDWPGDFTMTRDGRLERRASRAMSRPSSIPASASSSRNFSRTWRRTSSGSRRSSSRAAARGRLFGVRLDGLWLHVGRPGDDRGSGAGGRPFDAVARHFLKSRNRPTSSRFCKSWPIHWPRGETFRAMKLPSELGPIHFVGIGGIGMSGIAEVLINLGHSVQGSDASDNANVKRLREHGARVFVGHDAGQSRRGRGRRRVDRDQARQSGACRRRARGAFRSSAARRCSPN